jgi:rod shape-determining protein MreC
VEHSPPPFFKRGPAPLVRLFFFASLSLALLVLDARFQYGQGLRALLALVAYPLQVVATAPIDLAQGIGGYFSNQSQLIEENEQLRAKALSQARDAQRYQAAEAEAAQLRRLIGATERLGVRSQPAEVLYAGRDPYSQKVFIDRGATHGVRPGSPVADEAGVVGQVTRVHPLLSEVTLITDRDQATPVQVVRNGLRAVAFGAGASGMLELRFMAAIAEIQEGDRLVTSGIDGTYPAGLPVATVVRVDRDPEQGFAHVVCKPAAGVDRGRYVLVLADQAVRPPKPEETQSGKERRGEKGRRMQKKDEGTRQGQKDGDAVR